MTFRLGLAFIGIVVLIGITYRLAIYFQGMGVTSWWRSFWHNEEVGGVKTSLHQLGLAWDVVPVTLDNEMKLRSMGLKVINEGDHLHAQIPV